jgi:hypothetical protein
MNEPRRNTKSARASVAWHVPLVHFSVIICGLAASMLICDKAFGLSPGFYEHERVLQVFGVLKQADLTLVGESDVDHIRIEGLDKAHGETPEFARAELRKFLTGAKHKDLLVIVLGPLIVEHSLTQSTISMKKFVSDLGYARVVILGTHPAGWYVLADESFKQGKQHKRAATRVRQHARATR